jgi:tetratricopeptide (TPR) repeat protein
MCVQEIGAVCLFEGYLRKSLRIRQHFIQRPIPVLLSVIVFFSCAYFNTVYNAKNYYRQGMKSVRHDTLMIDSENFDKAIEKATAIIVKYPDTRWIDDALFIMGASYYYKGDYSRSLEKLDFLLYNYPETGYYDEAQYLTGLANYRLKKYGSAIVALEQVMQSRKYRRRALIALVYIYYADGSYDRLYEIADTLLKGSLKYDERRTLLRFVGMAQFDEGKYTEALQTSKRLLEITRDEGDRRELKLRIAEIYLEIGEYDRCRDFVEGEVEPEFRDLLADLCMITGRTDDAKDIYMELTQHRQADISAEAYYELAKMYEESDSTELAVVHYDSALVKAPNSEYGLKARKRSDILKRIQTLTTDTEDEVRAQFLLAEIYFADLDDLPRALQGYERVYREYPSSKWAPKALYAHFWIARNVVEDDSLALRLARALISDYPRTEYAMSAKNMIEQTGGESDRNE